MRASLDAGAALGAAEALPGSSLVGASDFFRYGNGDVGWVQQSGAGLALARLKACP